MSESSRIVLVVGATGSIGRHVVEEAIKQGYRVRALVRDAAKAHVLPADAEIAVGDVTLPESLVAAVKDINAVIFTLGSDGQGKAGAEAIDYGGVRNVLLALGSAQVRIALMTSIGVTNRTNSYNQATQSHDWKRRAERLVRGSGLTYTIVRPGWFDYNGPTENKLVFLQGDRRQTGTPRDGVIARRQIAQVLVQSLQSANASRKTFELIATEGAAPRDLEPLFAELKSDSENSLDAVKDEGNQPLEQEPKRVRDDLDAVIARRPEGNR